MENYTSPIFKAKDFESVEQLLQHQELEPIYELPLPKGTWVSPQDKRIINF